MHLNIWTIYHKDKYYRLNENKNDKNDTEKSIQ